jgi:hypothetical protein
MKNLFFKTSWGLVSINHITSVIGGKNLTVALADGKTVMVDGDDARKLLEILDRMTYEIIAP